MFDAKLGWVDQRVFHLLLSQHPPHVTELVSPTLQVCAVIWVKRYPFVLVCHLSFTSGQSKGFFFISEVQEFGNEGPRPVQLLPDAVCSFQGSR